jgi:hypothetical protein
VRSEGRGKEDSKGEDSKGKGKEDSKGEDSKVKEGRGWKRKK